MKTTAAPLPGPRALALRLLALPRLAWLARERRGSGARLKLADAGYRDAPRIERILFIAGLHRSGTTLIERSLVARYDLACLRARVPESEGQHMQDVYAPALAMGGPGRFALSGAIEAERARLTDYPALRAALLADWARFVVGGSEVLVEKSPPNLLRIGWLRQVFPGARFVIVARDPRAVAGATRKWSGTSLERLMAHWDAAYGAALAEAGEDCLITRYEDFCASPEAELIRIADFAELASREGEGDGVEGRFARLTNSNARYVAMHGEARYGPGAWDELGYEVE